MKVGRLHVQVLDEFDPGELLRPCSLYLTIWRLVLGFVAGDAAGHPFLDVFLGWWLVELIYDRDGSWEADDA